MIILGFGSFLLGALLARRFKVFVLVPASIAVAIGGVVEANFETAGFAMMLVMISSSVILLQIGYLVGLA